MEPFLTVRGRLQKDGATMNVIASRVEPLRMAPVMRSEATESPDREIAGGAYRYLTALRQSPPGIKSFG